MNNAEVTIAFLNDLTEDSKSQVLKAIAKLYDESEDKVLERITKDDSESLVHYMFEAGPDNIRFDSDDAEKVLKLFALVDHT